jgi:putative addiction module component (TIGR02574 family)
MSMDPTKVRDEAMRLPADERARLAADLLGSLDEGDDEALDPDEHEAAWNAEIAERMRQIDSGEVKPVPWSEARRRITRED